MRRGKRIVGVMGGLMVFLPGAMSRVAQAQPPPPPGGETVKVEEAKKSGPIALTVKPDKSVYKSGEPIRVTLTAKNTTKAPVTLRFSSGQRFDVEIRPGKDPKAKPVYVWSYGMMFFMSLGSLAVAPDKPQTFTALLVIPAGKPDAGRSITLSPGTYTVTGLLTTMDKGNRPTASTIIQVK